jgi:hypothetical protein
MEKKMVTLSALWIFVTLNYLYCDVVTLMDAKMLPQFLAGRVGNMHITETFLLGGAMLIEVPIAMVLVSRLAARHAVNRWANLVAGGIMTIVQAATLFTGTPSSYYLFFSAIEIATTMVIVGYALRWKRA